MFLSAELTDAIALVLSQNGKKVSDLMADRSISGGINQGLRMKAGGEHFFLKINSASRYPHMFALESQGLKLIESTRTIRVPKVRGFGVAADEQFLLMDWVTSGRSSKSAQSLLGQQLARLHKITENEFGLDHDNYLGSRPQINSRSASWTDFFSSNRIEPLVKISVDKGLMDKQLKDLFRGLLSRLDQLYPKESPALLHGDLWSGNYLISDQGEPFLIDPAVYFGHREVDLAMSTLFGGFANEFYEAYQDEFPLEKGWQDRLSLWNLYPLLVHLILFGPTYLPQIKGVLKRLM